MSDLGQLREYIEHKISKIDDDMLQYKDEEEKKEQILNELSIVINILESDINEIDLDKLSNILENFESKQEIEYDLSKLKEALSLYKFLINPQIPNLGVKLEILNFLSNFKDKLNNYYNSVSVKGFSKNHFRQRQLLELQKTYGEYLTLFSDNSFVKGLSVDKMNEFFDFLENSSLERKVIFSLIAEYAIFNCEYFQKRGKIRENIIENTVLENAKRVRDKLKSNNVDVEIPQVDESLIQDSYVFLTEEEEKIKKCVEELIEQHRKDISDVGSIIAIQLFNNLTIDIRKNLYIENDNIDWDIVVADFDINLLKNLSNNKDSVLEIFKFILEQNEKAIERQINKEETKKEFLLLKDNAKNILKEAENILIEHSKKEEEVKNEYELIYKIIKNGQIKSARKMSPELNFDEVIIVGVLKELDEYLQILDLEEENIDMLNLNEINNDLTKCINKYNEYKVKIGEKTLEQNIEQNDVVEEIFLESGELDYDKTKNLILLLKESDGSFNPLNDIYEDVNFVQTKIKDYEFCKALQVFSTRTMENRKKELASVNIVHTSETGKERTIKEIFGFDAERLRFSEMGRTGYVLIPVCEENRRKLREVYGENIFNKFNSIIMIIGVIYCGSNHNEYKEFCNAISRNEKYIRYVINLFNNPNTDVNTLTEIIEESMGVCQRYTYHSQESGQIL